MKGNLVKYVEDKIYPDYDIENIAIVIDYLPGYNIRKSWSDKRFFVEEPLIKVYWLNSPVMIPETAKCSIMGDWNKKEIDYNDLFNSNVLIDEWNDLNDDWYLASFFELIGDKDK